MTFAYYKTPHPVAYSDEILAPVPGWGMTPNLAGDRIIGIGDSDGGSWWSRQSFISKALIIGVPVVGIWAYSAWKIATAPKYKSLQLASKLVGTGEFKPNKSKRLNRRAKSNRRYNANNPAVIAAAGEAASLAAKYGPIIVEGSKAAYTKAKPYLKELYAKYGEDFKKKLEGFVVEHLKKTADEKLDKVASVASKRLDSITASVAKANRRTRRR